MRNSTTATFLIMSLNCAAAQLSPSTERAFYRYVANLETRLARQHAGPETYLAVSPLDVGPGRGLDRQLKSGEVRVEAVNGGTWQVGGALLHHWRAAAFVPGAAPKDMVALLRDFDHLALHYAPQVVSSRALTDGGQTATHVVRFKVQKMLTFVFDAEYETEAKLSENDRGYSISRSANIWQIDNPGTEQEHRRSQIESDGFFWHLNSYWSFARIPQGLQIECEAVSLTRDVPLGLGWLITPFIADFPRDELTFTLRATRSALIANIAQEQR
jgi:hypothetical protein